MSNEFCTGHKKASYGDIDPDANMVMLCDMV